ncbi:D-alanyl-D-alanine carboxypeptidase [Streptomyces paludis]
MVATANRTEEPETPGGAGGAGEDSDESDGGPIAKEEEAEEPKPKAEEPKAEEVEEAKEQEADAKAPSWAKPAAVPEAEAEPEAEPEADASQTAPASPASSTTSGEDASGAPEAPESTESTPAPAKGSEAAEDPAKPAPDPEADADRPAAEPEGKADDKTDGKTDAESGAESSGESVSEASDKSDKPADSIDRPTTVFKALPRPAVDQPTTALKIPPSLRDKAKPEAHKADEPKPDEPKSSTFVPLRRDDKPTPAPAAATSTTPGKAKPATPAPAVTSPVPTPPAAATAAFPEAERTRQQPMPPMPPLDLLAELTNTPETAARKAVRRVKIWTPLVVLAAIVFVIIQAVRPLPAPELTLSADAGFTFDGEKLDMPYPGEGQGAVEVEGVGAIGTFGEQKPAPIASVAKTMTAYVILKEHPIKGEQDGPDIKVDKKAGEEADRPDESVAPIKTGQKYTEKQMLQLLMIPSGNNAARLLARWDSGSEDAFVEKMNAAAKELGMTDTTYTDPSGLDAATVSTPLDQIKLARAVMQNDVFRAIVDMPQADIPGIGKTIYNNNTILLEPGVGGIKTGSSTPAGGNLLWSANTVIDGKPRRILGVVMGMQKAGTLDEKLTLAKQESLKLIQAAQAGVRSETVLKKGDVVGYVDDGLGTRTPVVATKDLKAVGWGGFKVKVALDEGGETVPHSAAAGTVVGRVTAGKESVPVALQSALAEPGFGAKLTRLG